MEVLPFELVALIAASDPIAFARMIQACKQVYEYVCTPAGKKHFLSICMLTIDIDRETIATYSLICNNVHSFFDLPAVHRPNGRQEWYLFGEIGRDNDQPAIVHVHEDWKFDANGYGTGVDMIWYYRNKEHRVGGLPAIIAANGDRQWKINGIWDSDIYPSLVFADGRQEWYKDNKRHCGHGPAIIFANGDRLWGVYGKMHRIGDPAFIGANGEEMWFLNGVQHDPPVLIAG